MTVRYEYLFIIKRTVFLNIIRFEFIAFLIFSVQTSKKRKTKLSADLCTPDCASSNKGKCNNVLLQMKVVEQKTKIRRLNQRIRRLLQKIKRIEKSSPAT